ncbi:alpha/beta hydrolase [Thermobifida fusca]|uniref:Alpha/beta hydrolase n=2 Tax=Thermobifida fusca TaxID=2021 RepID=A0A9P2TDC2_THEFU|nr:MULTISPECIES: alpha/beta hydrolase [Thermobifida]AAZ54117.1 similar to hydrolases or acyltransferases (alpha/beta hydrolase superfamily) [Thermobifida fusca YX]EOR72935.1 alpha/beta hydrolase [Thermobifida fusca TM51]MBO2530942.1 alpha/beta hydrolase [Thermobifida sp.]MDD6792845.1 alpha/beta hydrolase [Thermobifida fusca]PPS92112.1 alpha/beta hydrolase [Thermobifida fusca]
MTGTEFTVDVAGGALTVTRWGSAEALPVVALHGITANGHSFARVAAELPDTLALLAPDLRGRARSAHLPGPYGLGAHVADTMALLDAVGVDRTVLVGHSMGAFVACLAAVRHPDRVAGVVLVDGGFGLPAPPGTDIQQVIGPAMARLSMTFADRDTYRSFWQKHPAFAGRWNTWADTYVQRDLVGDPPEMRSSCVADAVRIDGAQVLEDPEVLGAIRALPCPAWLMWAARGLLDETPGLYTAERLAALDGSGVQLVELPDDNHYTPLFSSTAATVAAQIHTAVQQTMEAER